MTQKQIQYALVGAAIAIALVGAYFGVKLPAPAIPEPDATRGITGTISDNAYFEHDVTVAGTLGVAGATSLESSLVFEGATADAYETTVTLTDPTADRTITLPNVTGTVMLTSTPGAIVLGTNTITGTLTISHGLTTPQTVFCTLLQDSEANAATCSATISGGTVVVKTWKADGATAGSVGKIVSWMVGGQP